MLYILYLHITRVLNNKKRNALQIILQLRTIEKKQQQMIKSNFKKKMRIWKRIFIWNKLEYLDLTKTVIPCWFFKKYTGSFPTEAGTSREYDTEKKLWNKIQIISDTSRTEVIWGHEWVCEWLIQDVWRASSQSLEILIRLKRRSWTVRPVGRLPIQRPLKVRDVIFIRNKTRINNHNGFIFEIPTPLV